MNLDLILVGATVAFAEAIRTAVGMATADLDTQLEPVAKLHFTGDPGSELVNASASVEITEEQVQDIADAVVLGLGDISDPLLNTVPGDYGPNTAGEALGMIARKSTGSSPTTGSLAEKIDDILADTSTIQSGTITVVSPVSADGQRLEIVVGDSYSAARGRSIDFSDPGDWPADLGDATITLTIRQKNDGSLQLTKTGSVVAAVGETPRLVRFQPTATETALMTATSEWADEFQVRAVWIDGSAQMLIASNVGECNVVASLSA